MAGTVFQTVTRSRWTRSSQCPGSLIVYIMKDAKGRIIYVGKAVVLKNRVRQYF